MSAISIIIPTCKRPESLRACLDATRGQINEECELIVVDDEVSPSTAEICASQPGVRYVPLGKRSAAAARNHGARLAQGEWLVFLDDDCAPAAGWLRNLREACLGDENVMAGGRMLNALPENPYAEASQTLLDFVYRHYNAKPDESRFLASSNVIVSKDRFVALGGFDESYPHAGAEDRDFCARWLESGGQIRFVPAAMVHHAHVMNVRGFCRQHYRYGRGARRFHVTHAQDANGGMESAAYYGQMLAHPLHSPGGVAGVRLTALLILSQVMSTLGFFREAVFGGRP